MGAALRPPVTFRLFVRDRCPLCEEAKLLVRSYLPEREVGFDEIDVDADPYLRERYTDWVPVGFIAAREVFRLRPERDEVRRAAGLAP